MNKTTLLRTGKSNRNSGFTIIELVVIVVVIGILVGIVSISYNAIVKSTREESVKADLQSSAAVIAKFNNDNGQYPAIGDIELPATESGVTYKGVNADGHFCVEADVKGETWFMMSNNKDPKVGVCPAAVVPPVSGPVYNYVTNPSATSLTGVNSGVTLMTDGGFSGSTYVRRSFTAPATGTTISMGSSSTDSIPVTPGDTYRFSIWARSSKPTPFVLRVGWNRAEFVITSPSVIVGPEWVRLSVAGTAPTSGAFGPSTAASMMLTPGDGKFMSPQTQWAAGDWYDADAFMASGGSLLTEFRDGSFPNCSWQGATNNSTSVCTQI